MKARRFVPPVARNTGGTDFDPNAATDELYGFLYRRSVR
jgi:hypothetical protein